MENKKKQNTKIRSNLTFLPPNSKKNQKTKQAECGNAYFLETRKDGRHTTRKLTTNDMKNKQMKRKMNRVESIKARKEIARMLVNRNTPNKQTQPKKACN